MPYHVGQIEPDFTVQARIRPGGPLLDLTGFTSARLRLLRPDGTVLGRSATFASPRTTGAVSFQLGADDLNDEGLFEVWLLLDSPDATRTIGPASLVVEPAPPAET